MDERMDWSAGSLVRLLDEYRKRPELWCKRHRLYREHSAKYESWSDLAAQFDGTIAEIRKKLNSIFASYRREKIKIRQGGTTHWFLYEHLKFLPNHVEPANKGPQDVPAPSNCATESRSGESSDDNEEAEEEEEEEKEDNTEENEPQVVIKQEPDTSETYSAAVVQVQEPPAQPRKRGRPRMYIRNKLTQPMKRKLPQDLDSKLLETLKLLKKSNLSRKKDECDSFGEYIAMSLRKHDERTQSMIKQAINNILFEQEMRIYSAGQYTVVLTGVDENPLVCEEK